MTEDKPFERGMVVVAHADDAEYGCSGTVARWCREGMEVVYVLCTDGSKGSSEPGMTSRQLVDIRRLEQIEAGKVLGLSEVVFLEYEDAMLEPNLALRKDITRQIRKFKPDILICQNPVRNLEGSGYLGHPDHIAAGEATISAVFPASRDRLTFPELLEEGLEPHKVRELLVSGTSNPDKWIDVSETTEIAIQALLKHVSQVNPGNEPGKWMKERRRKAGEHIGMLYAESYKHFHLA